MMWAITGFIVIPAGQILTIDDLVYDESLSDPLYFMLTPNGAELESSKIDDTHHVVDMGFEETCIVNLADRTLNYNSFTNFGDFVEINVTIGRGINSTNPVTEAV